MRSQCPWLDGWIASAGSDPIRSPRSPTARDGADFRRSVVKHNEAHVCRRSVIKSPYFDHLSRPYLAKYSSLNLKSYSCSKKEKTLVFLAGFYGIIAQQRDRLTSRMAICGITLQVFTFDLIRTALLELVCDPRSSLHNPSFRPTNQQRTVYVQDYSDLDGSTCCWAAEEETGQ